MVEDKDDKVIDLDMIMECLECGNQSWIIHVNAIPDCTRDNITQIECANCGYVVGMEPLVITKDEP